MSDYRERSRVSVTFESTAEWYAYLEKIPPGMRGQRSHDNWAGNSYSGFLQACKQGASEYKQNYIRDVMAQLDASVQDRTIRQTVSDVAGYNPNVPEYLIGLPTHMRRKELVQTRLAPVRLYMDMFVSAGCSDNAIQNRAAAACALAARLAQDRAVELWLCWACGVDTYKAGITSIGRVRVSTAPVHLAELVEITSKSSTRIGVFNTLRHAAGYNGEHVRYSQKNDGSGIPHKDYDNPEPAIREAFHLSENDIVVNGARLMDSDFYSPQSAIAWANKELARQAKFNETY